MSAKNSFSFGRYLMSRRLKMGIEVEDVAEETKIGVDTLILIENEDHSKLPAEVFVKGFLRSYAKVIGADGDEAVRRYMANRNVFKAVIQPDHNLKELNSGFWVRVMVSFGSFFAVIILSVIFIFFYGKTI